MSDGSKSYNRYLLLIDPFISSQGPGIYYVDTDGNRFTHHIFSVGSGSTYAYGVLDSSYNWDLTVDAARELGRRARDASVAEKPIRNVSRTLSAAEKNYSQLKKGRLSCVFGVKCFHS